MRILYAEDEKQLSMAVTAILKMEGFEVDAVYDGQEAWEYINNNDYDAAIFDIMMPKLSGTEVVEKMRESSIFTPVLLLTAKNETEDRIQGLSSGADDYLGKPFAMAELVARLQAMLRRTNQYKNTLLTSGNISLNCETNELKSPKGSLRLSSKEAELLGLFLRKPNSRYTADQLLEQLWPDSQDGQTIVLYVSYLQNKLKQLHGDRTICQEDDVLFLTECFTDL